MEWWDVAPEEATLGCDCGCWSERPSEHAWLSLCRPGGTQLTVGVRSVRLSVCGVGVGRPVPIMRSCPSAICLAVIQP